MIDVIEIIECVLKEEIDPGYGKERIKEFLEFEKDRQKLSKSTSAFRICRSLENIKSGNETWYDFAGHLRQFILYYKRRMIISRNLASEIEKLSLVFSLKLMEQANGEIEVDVSGDEENGHGLPGWFEGKQYLRPLYDLEERKSVKKVLGDGILHDMTGYNYYSSAAQKNIIRAAMDLPEGFTLLGCLPTGGGKSLVFQMPSFYTTEGGTLSGVVGECGTTVVIVPTIALAMDQARSAREFFKDALDEAHKPQAYYSDIKKDKELMNQIRRGIFEGTLPILYTSPEALLSHTFRHLMFEAAERKMINYLVVDEAHIVVDWGESFRTEFQFLAMFRKNLLEKSKGKLKTILVSATLTDRTTDILKNMFSEEGKFIEIRGDALRPEPMYWVFKDERFIERERKLKSLLPLLPRPVIIYVNTRQDASDWLEKIKEWGFNSVATFTGNTADTERKEIIEKWSRNEIDIITATSAFGMGVDKSDVRTVIHCCMPESINRFYQEVGRGGRDGFPSLSIFLSVPEKDIEVARDLTKDAVLTAEMIGTRWKAMYDKSVFETGNTIWVDTNTKPPHLEDRKTGRPNANFNGEVILFLYRNSLIDILDLEKLEGEFIGFKILVEIKPEYMNVLQDEEKLVQIISEERDRERSNVTAELDQMYELIIKHDFNCWGSTFKRVYRHVRKRCGGCPNCREMEIYPDNETVETLKVIGHSQFVEEIGQTRMYLSESFDKLLGAGKEVLLRYDNNEYGLDDSKLYRLTSSLVKSRVTTIIVPETDDQIWNLWINELPSKDCLPYLFYSTEEILSIMKKENKYLLSGPIAIFYPRDEQLCDEIFNWAKRYIQVRNENRVIHIGYKNMKVNGKPVENQVNGIANDIDVFVRETQENYGYSSWL